MATEAQATISGGTRAATKRRILVLDDEHSIRVVLKSILEGEGYSVLDTDDGREALDMMAAQSVDLIIQDLRMPKMDGLTFLKSVKQKFPDVPSIVLTAFGTLETAVEAMRLGAYTHMPKPFDTVEMREMVARALERHEIGRKSPRSGLPYLDMISNTAAMAQITSLINRIAPTDSTVLITGESGTGKELVARAIHFGSLRAEQPFVPVNCGAFAETLLESELFGHVKGAFTNAISDRMGVFESADRGTLFLDEIGEMSPPTQVKLLRVLETRSFKPVGGTKEIKVDVRIIAATNRNLGQMSIDGQFREDLFYRLNVIPIELPPLRDRKDDIPLLAGHFLAKFAKRMGKQMAGIDSAVIEKLQAYAWPGNIRQLENTIERAVALSRADRITIADLAGPVLGGNASARLAAGIAGGTTTAAAVSLKRRNFIVARAAFCQRFAGRLDGIASGAGRRAGGGAAVGRHRSGAASAGPRTRLHPASAGTEQLEPDRSIQTAQHDLPLDPLPRRETGHRTALAQSAGPMTNGTAALKLHAGAGIIFEILVAAWRLCFDLFSCARIRWMKRTAIVFLAISAGAVFAAAEPAQQQPAYTWKPGAVYRFEYSKTLTLSSNDPADPMDPQKTEIGGVLILEIASEGTAALLRFDGARIVIPPVEIYGDTDEPELLKDKNRIIGKAVEGTLNATRWDALLATDGTIHIKSRKPPPYEECTRELGVAANWRKKMLKYMYRLIGEDMGLKPDLDDQELLLCLGAPSSASPSALAAHLHPPRGEPMLAAREERKGQIHI